MSTNPDTQAVADVNASPNMGARVAALEAALSIGSPSWQAFGPPNGIVNSPYNYQMIAAGNQPMTYQVVGGALPTGLSLNPNTGVISGTPTSAAVFNFTISATNVLGTITDPNTVTIAASAGSIQDPLATVGLAHPGGGSWTNAFGDEFDGGSSPGGNGKSSGTPNANGCNALGINLTKWRPNWLGGNDTDITKPSNGGMSNCHDPAQSSCLAGATFATLKLVSGAFVTNAGANFGFAGGMLQTAPHFTFTLGYLEARVWLPPGQGTPVNWPGFWTDTTGTWPSGGEWDIMEILSGQASQTAHSQNGTSGSTRPPNHSGGWRLYGLNWQNGVLDWYADNGDGATMVKTGSATAQEVHNLSQFVIFQHSCGSIGGATQAPANFQIDYFRYWN